MSSTVLDASAILAVLKHEPGEAVVEVAMEQGAAISAVNFSEVAANWSERNLPEQLFSISVERFNLELFDFDRADALSAGWLRAQTRHLGLSFGDRACIALAARLGLPVLTADRRWADLDPGLGVEVRVIR